ncbi:hypothetical protein C0971_10155 [Bacillus methanolicus]|uniref:hypothetical protein n=1 Tax=Bacillus methanolicus TaxID=1471 RepID=UPI00200D5829|nr:hypothetical protein [Bacillus methanolicus]UQD52334.1 hypothetical protein C0971_10155 [Bacillus methanolicus]
MLRAKYLQVVVSHCANPNCKWPIYRGDEVWQFGRKLYCHGQCLVEGMNKNWEGGITCETIQ